MTYGLAFLFILLVFWRPQEWLVPQLYGWPLLDILVAIALIAMAVELQQGKVQFPRQSPHVYLLLGIWFASVWSHVVHTYFVGMMATIPLVFKYCLFTVLLLTVLDQPARLRSIAWLFVAMALVMSVHALLQESRGYGFAGDPPIPVVRPDGRQYTRSQFFGIFGDPNDLAQILVTTLPFCFVLTRRRSPGSLLVGLAMAAFLVRAVVSTHSRGGYVALGMTMACLVLLLFPARWTPALMLGLLTAALAACPLSAGYLDESAHDRVIFWGQANRVFKSHALFGIGTNMFSEYIEGERAAHNAFVLCYTETGFFGYWFWFSILQLGFMGLWRARVALGHAKSEEERWLRRFAGALMAAGLGYFTAGYFIGRAFVYPTYFLFALMGAVPLVARRFFPGETLPFVRPKKDLGLWCTLGSALSIVYLYISIILLNKAYYGHG